MLKGPWLLFLFLPQNMSINLSGSTAKQVKVLENLKDHPKALYRLGITFIVGEIFQSLH